MCYRNILRIQISFIKKFLKITFLIQRIIRNRNHICFTLRICIHRFPNALQRIPHRCLIWKEYHLFLIWKFILERSLNMFHLLLNLLYRISLLGCSDTFIHMKQTFTKHFQFLNRLCFKPLQRLNSGSQSNCKILHIRQQFHQHIAPLHLRVQFLHIPLLDNIDCLPDALHRLQQSFSDHFTHCL